ncbi:MAG: DUF935 family protein [Hyphomicrobium sp.]|nr:DUF935 family protein [Hyphomicrobium sp.]
MSIEFAEVKGGNTRDPVFSGFAQYLDAQVSKLVLGQTMTTDNGSSMAQAKVLNTCASTFSKPTPASLWRRSTAT